MAVCEQYFSLDNTKSLICLEKNKKQRKLWIEKYSEEIKLGCLAFWSKIWIKYLLWKMQGFYMIFYSYFVFVCVVLWFFKNKFIDFNIRLIY